MIVSKAEISNFIPQRPPFVMVDNLTVAETDFFESDFIVSSDNIFLENGQLREYALIENIAQTTGAGLAVTRNGDRGNIAGNYLGAVSKLTLFDLPKPDDKIHTVVRLIAQFENLYLLKGETWLNNKKLMECELKLAGF